LLPGGDIGVDWRPPFQMLGELMHLDRLGDLQRCTSVDARWDASGGHAYEAVPPEEKV
jgi:hypothetical protein